MEAERAMVQVNFEVWFRRVVGHPSETASFRVQGWAWGE